MAHHQRQGNPRSRFGMMVVYTQTSAVEVLTVVALSSRYPTEGACFP